jgi:hypothetical protein
MRRSLLLAVVVSSILYCRVDGQSLTGVTGLLNSMSANMQKDGTFYTGVNYLNRNYVKQFERGKYNCLIFYFDMTFLPFLELNFRNTRLLDDPDPTNTVDRMVSVRLRVLKEKKYWPSIVIGANDIFTQATKGNQYFGALYIVGTKNFPAKRSELGLTLGYAFPIFKKNQFIGVFGGVTFSPSFLRQLTLMAEYDSRSFNIGGSVLFFKHLYVFALLQGMDCLTGGAAFRISAYSGIKSIKQKKNKE